MRFWASSAIIVNAILIALLAVNAHGLLSPLALTYGVIGSILLTMPFFREQRARKIFDILKSASVSGGGNVFEEAAERAAGRLSSLEAKWTDIYLALSGLLFVCSSYVVGLLGWILADR